MAFHVKLPEIGVLHVYCPSPKLKPASADAFMLPLKSERLPFSRTQGPVNVIKPKLSTVPAMLPSPLEIMLFRIIRKRGMVRELPVVRLVGNV